MAFTYRRQYIGSVKAIIFDWAGTIIDFGCMAPAQVFAEIFKEKGIDVTNKQAREPMGLQKRDHIAAIAAMPEIAKQWHNIYQRPITDADIDDMFENFVPLQQKVVENYVTLIPDVKELIEDLRDRGIKIGSTTGYTGKIMEIVTPLASAQGYTPDCLVTGDFKPKGRPAPFMLFENLRQLKVYPLAAVIKIGDTVPDIEEGLNAGVWSVAVVDSSNEIGMSYEDWSELNETQKEERRVPVRAKFQKTGAHFVIDSLADLPELIDEIEFLISEGKQP